MRSWTSKPPGRCVWTRCQPIADVGHSVRLVPDVRSQAGARTEEPSAGAGGCRELLQEGVFHESTVEQVAARAGVSRATVYQQFGSRLGLVDAICEGLDLAAVKQAEDIDTLLERTTRFWANRGDAVGSALRRGCGRPRGSRVRESADTRPVRTPRGARRSGRPAGAWSADELRDVPGAPPARRSPRAPSRLRPPGGSCKAPSRGANEPRA